MQTWLEESCRASGVPLKVTDPATLAKVAVLLGAGGSVARSDAARARQGVHSSGKITRPKRETGQYGNTRPRDDAHVRRARRMETDGRLKAAKADQEEHERKLAALDQQLSTEVHIPYRPTILTVVPDHEEIAAVPTTSTKVDIDRARELISQGYHIERVVKKTGVPVEMLKSLVGSDGYKRG